MKQFIFSLETLLKIRKEKEKRLQKTYMLLQQEYIQGKKRETGIQKESVDLREEIVSSRQVQRWAVQEMYGEKLEGLREKFEELRGKNHALEEKLTESQAHFQRAIEERRVLNKIRERERHEWKRDFEKLESVQLEEWYSSR